MAKVLNPLMSNEARGKMNGLIYNTWRGICTVKTFKAPTKAKTAAQLAIMALMTTISKAWALLSDAQRAAWATYADNHLKTDWTGNPVRVTGANAFSGCSMLASLAGGVATTIDDPPVDPAPVTTPATVVFGDGVLSITHTTPSTSDTAIEVRWRDGDSQGRQRAINEMRNTTIFLSNAGSPYTLDISAYPGKCTAFYRSIDKITGLASSWTKQSGTINIP